MSEDDLQNADLSNLRVNEMTVEQRMEMRRRYQNFIRNVMKGSAIGSSSPPAAKNPTKWVPTKVIR